MRLKQFNLLAFFMPNSKSEQIKKWIKRIAWIAGFAAKFMPANIRAWALALSTLAGGVVTLLDSCDKSKSPPAPIATAIPTQAPTPTPSPTPTPKPTPQPPELKAPRYVKAGTPFWVELCGIGNRYDVGLYVDDYRLGTMGFGKPCMKMSITLNMKGDRVLHVLAPNVRYYADITVE